MQPTFVSVEDAVQPATCKKIVQAYADDSTQDAPIGGAVRAREVRDARLIHLPIDRGISATMTGIGLAVNRSNWRFDVTHVDQCDFLRYDKEGHYDAHLDVFMDRDRLNTRKLTTVLILNDDYEGGRFFLHEQLKKTYPVQKPGTVIVFPSFLLHGVEPVTSGQRFSLVNWLVGPWLR